MTLRSALYVGSVAHRRLYPRAHDLRYRAFWMLIDLDEIASLPREQRLLSYNRFNAASFYDRDHGDGSDTPLRQQIDRHLRAAGIETEGGPIKLLCMPRVFGYGFNPLSIYFCYRHDDTIAAMLYEVHNTFKQRHSYLIPVKAGAADAIRQRCDKIFYVSPFMEMDLRYEFRVSPPDEHVSVVIDTFDRSRRVLTATLTGKRVPLTTASLLRALATHPALTLKVIGAIHLHALRLLLKGFRLQARPQPPENPVTVVTAGN